MSNKRLQEITNKTGNVIVTIYFLVITLIYPFYVNNGYYNIGKAKYLFFRNASIIITYVMIFIAIVGVLLQIKRKPFSVKTFYKNLSVTDWFVYGYFISVLISYIATPFSDKALVGADGWYMGLVTQLLFVSIYFMFSRYFSWHDKALFVILISSGLVFLLGILNRYSIYPFYMNGQTPVFISTLGNINWFCGYLAVICPLGIVFYWQSKSLCEHIAAGIYVVIGFIIGLVQGSSSVYIALIGIFVFLFSLSFEKNQDMYRFFQICMLFMLSCQVARLCRYLPGFYMNYENELGAVLTDSNLTIYIGIIIVAIYILYHYMIACKSCNIKSFKIIRNIALALMMAAVLIYIILLVANTCLPDGIFGLSGVPFLTFNDEWASHRGATWSIGAEAYRELPLTYKITGIGPDCFAEYVYLVPVLANHTIEQFGNSRLTNAHNEWLTLLVNQGIIGLICYAGIFVTAFIRFVKKAADWPALYICAASILIYTVHNMVSFQQVLNAPFVFMLLGIGEGICRKISDGRT